MNFPTAFEETVRVASLIEVVDELRAVFEDNENALTSPYASVRELSVSHMFRLRGLGIYQ